MRPWSPADAQQIEDDWRAVVGVLYREVGGTGGLDVCVVRLGARMVVSVEGDGLTLTRVLDWDSKEVHHQTLLLAAPLQHKGFATRLNETMYRQYKASGFVCVKVYATLSGGGYVWAAEGFEWDGHAREQATMILERVWEVVSRRGATVEERRLLSELEDRLERDDIPKPKELGRIGRTSDALTWLGKEAMMGSSWQGRKDL